MPNILITTLGYTWEIVPELLGFTNPDHVNFYAEHPHRDAIMESRRRAGILPVDECWIVTTRGETNAALAEVERWHSALPENGRPVLRVRKTAEIDDPGSEQECRYMAECVFRLALHCSERAGEGQLLISLAGGRKTMSADMQNAAMFFGCHALLHVIQGGNGIMPLVIGRFKRNPILDLGDGLERETVSAKRFPLVENGQQMHVADFGLTEEIWSRQNTAGFLYCNHTNRLMGQEKASNFLALYNLPPAEIQRLKEFRIGVDRAKEQRELAWLRELPKTELHCHLGGVADAEELIEIAAANEEGLQQHRERLSPWLEEWKRKLNAGRLEDMVFKELRKAVPSVPEPLCTAAFLLLFHGRADALDRLIHREYVHESRFRGIDIGPYEALGDLQGSGLLQSEESLRTVCRILSRKAVEHNVKHLEVRCSPVNYTRGGLAAERVARIIDEELKAGGPFSHALIFIASRHGKMSVVHEHIELAEELLGQEGNGFPAFQGFDLAGKESALNPAAMREAFMPMMERCAHFTIHAGETEEVNRIWEAVYHLNAERIGHGLKLMDNRPLMERFRDKNIALEMCPSSNVQIVGFQDNYLAETAHLPIYPLKGYLDEGLRVTVNTDNLGISRTDFTRELHRAARLTPGGLSLWEILLLIRNSFKASFCKSDARHRMLREAESEILAQIQRRLP